MASFLVMWLLLVFFVILSVASLDASTSANKNQQILMTPTCYNLLVFA